MQAVIDWIKSIAYYVIIISVFQGILPDNRYKKYVQLFTGLVLVLLVISPIVRLAGKEENMASLFSQYAEDILQGDFYGEVSEEQTSLFVEAEIKQMMEECGYETVSCRLSFDTQGQICRIGITLRKSGDGSIQMVAPIELDAVSLENEGEETAGSEQEQILSVLTELLAQQYELEKKQIDVRIL